MTEQEAIKEHIRECNHRIEIIESAIENKVIDADSDGKHNIEVMKMAITALKEIQQYRAIGTVAECREAVERQMREKPERFGDGEDGAMNCPKCGVDLWEYSECGFGCCPFCGQHIDWSE